MFCTNCGSKLTEGAKFCASCGTKTVANETDHFEKVLLGLNPQWLKPAIDLLKKSIESQKIYVDIFRQFKSVKFDFFVIDKYEYFVFLDLSGGTSNAKEVNALGEKVLELLCGTLLAFIKKNGDEQSVEHLDGSFIDLIMRLDGKQVYSSQWEAGGNEESSKTEDQTVAGDVMSTNKYQGNLFKITLARLPQGQDFEDPLSAVNGMVSAPVFEVGLVHAFKDEEENDRKYIAFSNGDVILESESIDEMVEGVIEAATMKIKLTQNEINELYNILSIQEDADYDLDSDNWTYSLGEGGEVRLSEDFVGSILINVTPYYSTSITLEGTHGVADDDSCHEEHEFCGAVINNDSQQTFAELIDYIIEEFKANPRRKIYIDELTLLLCTREETGMDVSIDELRKSIDAYLSGDLEDDAQAIYDGAVYACSVGANQCFGDDPDAEVDYEISWDQNEDGSYVAVVSPS